MADGDGTLGACVPTDGERVISLVKEVRQLRKEVSSLLHKHTVNNRYLTLVERFLSLAEGKHLQNQCMEGSPVRDGELDLEQVMEIAKALDVAERFDRLKEKDPAS